MDPNNFCPICGEPFSGRGVKRASEDAVRRHQCGQKFLNGAMKTDRVQILTPTVADRLNVGFSMLSDD